MKLRLEIYFNTDGDFSFHHVEWLKHQVDPLSPFYDNAIKNLEIHDDNREDETYSFLLECEGAPNPCRWAARDLLEHLITNGIGLVHYWVLKDIYNLLITPKEEVLWSDEDVHYSDTLSGNYHNSYLTLDIEH